MTASRREHRGDEGNAGFELINSHPDPARPGIADPIPEASAAAHATAGEAPDPRLQPSDRSRIPQESLADRVRRAERGS
jgi:hypothetical protein